MNRRPSGPIELGISGITDAEEIGAGGFGVVYRAVEEDLGRTVAVKVLSGNLDESAQYRFERERRAMGRLSGHPNIVTIYRGGYTTAGHAYLVMEFLHRGSLADRLAKAGPLGWEEATMFGVQLSGALETSHRAGVLHRDIKPANILLSGLGNAKLCDFGIARLQGAPETKSSVVTASLSHAPPDIVNGARPDARSDVYSLASTMFELIAGTPPFIRPDDESMVPILARIARDPVPRLPETQLPGPLYDVIERAMAKDPDERPATAVELGKLLADMQRQLGLAPTTIPIETAGPEGGPGRSGYIPFPDSSAEPLPAPTGRSPHRPTPGDTLPPITDEQALPGQTAPPTLVTSPDTDEGLATGSPPPDSTAPESTPPDPAPPGAAPPASAPPNESPTPAQPAASPPTVIDSGAASISRETIVSGQHDPSTWAPPTVSGEVRAGAGTRPPDVAHTGASTSGPLPDPSAGGLPRWLIPAVIAVVALAAIGGAFLAFGGDDDGEAGTGTTATVDGTATSTEAGGTDTTDDGGADDGGDYVDFDTIADDTGSITIDVPTVWDDRDTRIGSNDLPQLAAAPLLEDGFLGTSEVPGVQATVGRLRAASITDLDTALDFVLDGYEEPGCTSVSRTNISFPLPGRVERFADCDGGDTRLVHIAYFDEEKELTAVVRIQIVANRDDRAVETMLSSLLLEDNLPE